MGVEALRAAVTRTGKYRHGPLYRWMRARQPAFSEFLADERPTWQAVAEGLVSQGFATSPSISLADIPKALAAAGLGA